MLRVIRCTLVAASITLTCVGCHDATSPPNASPRNTRPTMSLEDNSLTALEVPPHETDPAIAGQWLNNHFVWLDPTADRRQKLFVHLPGTNNVPAQFTLLAKEAARLGYHVIRSEEHTSELQSPCNLVCRLLLEKKKKTYCSTARSTHDY